MKTVGIIGFGAIAQYVADRISTDPGLNLGAVVVREGRQRAVSEKLGDEVDVLSAIDERQDSVNLIIDCAGHDGLRQHGVKALAAGIDLVTVSVGALADRVLYQSLLNTAKEAGSRLHLVTGAIGGLDALSAASVGGLDKVVYRGRKPPAGWIGSPADEILDLNGLSEEAVHFRGTARKAALGYPKNANVAAAVALAGAGFDRTEVELIADPSVKHNIHEIEVNGEFGHFHFRISGNALPDNPKSSALTAMSVVRKVLNLNSTVVL